MKPRAHVNGKKIAGWAPAMSPRVATPSGPLRCPKHCDVATPPEHGGGDNYVCVCCGTQFTWKGKSS